MKFNSLLLFIFLSMLSRAGYAQQKAENQVFHLLVGTYTNTGKSEGIYVYEFDTQTGKARFKAKASGVENPSYLTLSNDGRFVYAVNETGRDKPGSLSAFQFDAGSGELTFLNRVQSGGDDPCYITTDSRGKYVFAGNYSGGSAAVFGIKPDGSLTESLQTIRYSGSSINKGRQDKPHVHCTVLSPDEKFLLVADLGTDKINVYRVSSKGDSVLTPAHQPYQPVAPGSGPRHLTFSPDGKQVYLIAELSASVQSFKYNKGRLTAFQTISMTDPGFKGKSGAADIHISPDCKFLYASNRGDANEIVIYAIGKDGSLSLAGRQSSAGKTPRNFVIAPGGNFLLAANQNSDEIIVFKRDRASGLLTPTGEKIGVGAPVCLKFAPTPVN